MLYFAWPFCRSTVPNQSDEILAEVRGNEFKNPWWDAINATGKYDRVRWPSVMWAGWYDIFLEGNLLGFNGFQSESAEDAGVRGKSRLVVDPLGHCQSGAVFFPDDLIAGRTAIALTMSFDLYVHTHTAYIPS